MDCPKNALCNKESVCVCSSGYDMKDEYSCKGLYYTTYTNAFHAILYLSHHIKGQVAYCIIHLYTFILSYISPSYHVHLYVINLYKTMILLYIVIYFKLAIPVILTWEQQLDPSVQV